MRCSSARASARCSLITKGFRDALKIGYQARPKIFASHIIKPEMLFERSSRSTSACAPTARSSASPTSPRVEAELARAKADGIEAVAIVFMHAYRYPEHEQRVAALAREMGFAQVSVSHEVSPLIKLVGRGDTTVVDAYLSPILRRYVAQVAEELNDGAATRAAAVSLSRLAGEGRGEGAYTIDFANPATPSPPLPRKRGGSRLRKRRGRGQRHAAAEAHPPDVHDVVGRADRGRAVPGQGRDPVRARPAAWSAWRRPAARPASSRLIGFDMGGTSTDVSHFDGEFERAFETEVAGVRMRAPMMLIHTVAAGGGSILHFDGARFRVGPDSAGANPGPKCYRRGGPLAVTDANVMVGKLIPDFFPKIFGPEQNQPLDAEAVRDGVRRARARRSAAATPEEIADGFIKIAVENMANAIKKISVQRGYDVTRYALNCFGGAGGQHACLVADALGMTKVLIHPFSSLLSAYGMGLADIRATRQQAIEEPLGDGALAAIEAHRRHGSARTPSARSRARACPSDDIVRACARPHPLCRHRHRAGGAGIHGASPAASRTSGDGVASGEAANQPRWPR